MRNVIILPFVFFLCGIVIFYKVNFILLSAVLSALFFILFYKKSKALAFFCTAFFGVGILAASIDTTIINNRYKMLTDLHTYEGIITEKDGNLYTLKNNDKKYKIKFAIYDKVYTEPGDYIVFEGQVQDTPDFKRRLTNIYGVDAWVSYKPYSLTISNHNKLASIPYRIRYRVTSALNNIDKEGGAFISGLICGYTGDIASGSKDNFKKLGISHILAVSGFNLAIIYYFISLVLKKINRKIRIPLVLILCYTYCLICGFEPSITRAFIMISVASLAGFTDKTYNVLNGLIVTAFLMLCYNTLYIFNIGFLLSYAAALGLILFSREIAEKVPERLKIIKDETAVTLSAFISTLPLIMFYNGYFSLLSILINIIIAPLVSIITILGFVSALLYLLVSCELLLYPVTFCGIVFIKIVHIFSKASLIFFTGSPAVLFIILYYVLLLMIFKYIDIKVSSRIRHCLYSAIIVVLTVTLIYRSSGLKIHFVNVGQGDCIFIETPKHETILVDTGPSFSDYIAVRDKVIPYINKLGYNKIDMLFISHFHNDHSGGVEYLLQNYDIKYLFSYDVPEKYKGIFRKVSSGDKITVENVAINILYPDEGGTASNNENEIGLVMELRFKDFNMLLTADVDKNVMDCISGSYDILKVPHHGSINSYSEKMLENSRIGTAVISVGKNSFGHPSKVVVDELYKDGASIYRTDLEGNVTIMTDGEKYTVNTEAE